MMPSMLRLLACLSLLNTFCLCVTSDQPDCVCDNRNQKASDLATYLYDDTVMRNVQHVVELLNASNEVQSTRLELLSARLEQQNDLLKVLHHKLETKTDVCSDSTHKDGIIFPTKPQFDVRTSFPQDEQIQHPMNRSCNAQLPCSCAEAAAANRKSGIYSIQIDSFAKKPFLVACDEETQGGGWTVIQRRLDGSIDFYRNWHDYKIGFGNLRGEFFIGLDRLHALTTETPQELLIVMEDFDNARKFAKYDAFAVGDESEAYALKLLGTYSGDAGDSLTAHSGEKFTTKDRDNDPNPDNCAVTFTGAWWYKKCHVSNLNGQYLKGAYSQDQFAKGVVWHTFRGYNYALKNVQMMIRPQRQ